MGTNVTRCIECCKWNWAGKEKCVVCGGELEPTFNEVYNYYMENKNNGRQPMETKIETEIATRQYPYYCFKRTDCKQYLEGRFWNQGGKQLAIVAVITQIGNFGDWAAYIGTDAPNSYKEIDTCIEVAKHGCKLSDKDAKHFFPEIKLSYRD